MNECIECIEFHSHDNAKILCPEKGYFNGSIFISDLNLMIDDDDDDASGR